MGASARPPHGMHLDLATYGQPQSLHWVASPPPPAADDVECDVAYGALAAGQHGPRCLWTPAHVACPWLRQSAALCSAREA